MKPSYGVYASLDRQTALIEAGSDGIGVRANDVVYEVSRAKSDSLSLIDYDEAIQFLEGCASGLSQMVAETPYHAEWKLQKHPKPSQIVGEWLRLGLGGKADGLMFTSTKNPRGKNVLLFATSSTELDGKFVAKPVKSKLK